MALRPAFKVPMPPWRVLDKQDSLFANPHGMDDAQLAEYHAALDTFETWAAYCKKLGVSIHSPRPTQPWDKT